MSQQTAMMQLLNYILVDCRNENGTIQFHSQETFNKFLEMEKEQIINAHGLKYYDITEEVINGEQYYKETYNK
jgi:hypothetical protein